jgi:hypothetical protein
VGKDQTVPYGTDSRLDVFQAINCLATIIQSLRDARGHHPDTPTRRYADTPIRTPAFPIDVPTHPAEVSQVGILTGMKSQFKTLRASSLYCQRCKVARPVRERLLLVLPDRELYDYLCTECGNSVGSREVRAAESNRPSLII